MGERSAAPDRGSCSVAVAVGPAPGGRDATRSGLQLVAVRVWRDDDLLAAREGPRMLRVLHVGKFYPPVTGGMERVVESLCHSTRGRLDSRVLAVNTGVGTVEAVVDGVPVTRVGTWGAAGSVAVAPAFAGHLKRAEADVMIVHEPNPWALLSYLVARPRIPLGMWFHSEVVRPRLQYDAFYAPMAVPVYRRARRIA